MKYSRNELLKLNNAPFRQLPPDFTIPAEITRSPSSTPEAEKRRRRRCARLFSVKNCELDCIAALYTIFHLLQDCNPTTPSSDTLSHDNNYGLDLHCSSLILFPLTHWSYNWTVDNSTALALLHFWVIVIIIYY